MLEKIDVFEDEDKKQLIINTLANYLEKSDRPYVALVPYIAKTGYPKSKISCFNKLTPIFASISTPCLHDFPNLSTYRVRV